VYDAGKRTCLFTDWTTAESSLDSQRYKRLFSLHSVHNDYGTHWVDKEGYAPGVKWPLTWRWPLLSGLCRSKWRVTLYINSVTCLYDLQRVNLTLQVFTRTSFKIICALLKLFFLLHILLAVLFVSRLRTSYLPAKSKSYHTCWWHKWSPSHNCLFICAHSSVFFKLGFVKVCLVSVKH